MTLTNECSRLLTNAIIYYNTLLLSKVYEQKAAEGNQIAQSILKSLSPVAWQHINLFGSFEFKQSTTEIDVEALAASYFNDPDYWKAA